MFVAFDVTYYLASTMDLGDALYKPDCTIQKTLDNLPKPLDKAFTCAILQLNLLTMNTVSYQSFVKKSYILSIAAVNPF